MCTRFLKVGFAAAAIHARRWGHNAQVVVDSAVIKGFSCQGLWKKGLDRRMAALIGFKNAGL
jgi:hypothetical protein